MRLSCYRHLARLRLEYLPDTDVLLIRIVSPKLILCEYGALLEKTCTLTVPQEARITQALNSTYQQRNTFEHRQTRAKLFSQQLACKEESSQLGAIRSWQPRR